MTKNYISAALKETPATIGNVVTVGNSLADLLKDESQLMDSMQIAQVADLQDRKLKLTSLLERYTRYLSHHPETVSAMTQEEKAELEAANEHLKDAMRENYEKLLVAREVNKAIVTCVTGVFAKKNGNELYNATGAMGKAYRVPAISVTLNKMI